MVNRTHSITLAVALAVAYLVTGMFCASSCSPRVITQIHYEHDSTYVERVRVDSIYIKDSIYVKDHGDTVWIVKEKWREKYKLIRDTVSVVHVDSVAVDREIIVEVEKPLSKWISFKIRAFPWLLGLLAAAVLYIFRKPIFKLLKSN